jgi:hypothetical protein
MLGQKTFSRWVLIFKFIIFDTHLIYAGAPFIPNLQKISSYKVAEGYGNKVNDDTEIGFLGPAAFDSGLSRQRSSLSKLRSSLKPFMG